VTRGKFAPADEQGRPLVMFFRSGDGCQSCACGSVSSGVDSLADFGRSKRVGDPGSIAPAGVGCRGGDPSESWRLKKYANLKTPAGAVFSLCHRRRATYWPSIHITYAEFYI
jgi:hypothetical protein